MNGYVMGKKIGAQSIVVSSTATRQVGREAEIFRFALEHSVALTALVGAIVTLDAWAIPWVVPSSPWRIVSNTLRNRPIDRYPR